MWLKDAATQVTSGAFNLCHKNVDKSLHKNKFMIDMWSHNIKFDLNNSLNMTPAVLFARLR